MEIWLDSTDSELITQASKMGILHGITTNPSIISRSGLPLEDIIEQLIDIQDGPVAIQVVAESTKEMIRQANVLTSHTPRVIIKIPVTPEGIKTIHELAEDNIPVMATAIFEPYQALLALNAGAHYIAPYVGRIIDAGLDAPKTLTLMQQMVNNYDYSSKILAAGLRDLDTILLCASLGIGAVTLNDNLFLKFIEEHPSTTEALTRFRSDWKNAKESQLLPKN